MPRGNIEIAICSWPSNPAIKVVINAKVAAAKHKSIKTLTKEIVRNSI